MKRPASQLCSLLLALAIPLTSAHAITPSENTFQIPDTVPEANREAFKALWPLWKEFSGVRLDVVPGQPGTESQLEDVVLNKENVLNNSPGREHNDMDMALIKFMTAKQYDQIEHYFQSQYPDPQAANLRNLGMYCYAMNTSGRYAQGLACVKHMDRVVGASLGKAEKTFRLPFMLRIIPFVGLADMAVNGSAYPPLEMWESLGTIYYTLADYYLLTNQHAKAVKASLASSLIETHCKPSRGMGGCNTFNWAGLNPAVVKPAILGLLNLGRTADAEKLFNLAMASKWDTVVITEQPGKAELAFSYMLAKHDFGAAQGLLQSQQTEANSARVGFFSQLFFWDTFDKAEKAGEYVDNYRQARLALELGGTDSADAYYARLVASPMYLKHRLMADQINLDLARLRKLQGRVAEAMALYRAAIEGLETGRRQFPNEAEKMGFVNDKQDAYGSLVDLLVDAGQVEEAFLYAERAKARTLVDLLADQQLADRNGITAEQMMKQAEAAVSSTHSAPETIKVTMAAPDASGTGMPFSAISPHATRNLAIRQNISRQSAELASLISVDVASLSEIRSQLNPGEALLEYFQYGSQLLAFVVDGQQVQVVRLNGEGMEQEVTRFRKVLTGHDEALYRVMQQSLYDRLFRPVRDMIGGNALAIVAHGPLHYLPFASLSDGNNMLIDDFALRTLPSATVLKFLKPRAKDSVGTLVFGNPDLGNRQHDLVFAEEEARRIAQIQPQNRLLLRKEASELAAKSESAKFGRVHFASHAVFEPDEPLKSGLLLAAEGEEDGRLTLGEIYGLKLNADLVVLSACETGIGKVSRGDEVVGLTRGFLYSGAATVVSSLWKVDDAATGYLMENFYAEMDRGAGKHEALRLAQLATREKFPSPYYWAAFQITGNVQ